MKSGAARATCLHSICSIEMASVGPTLEVDAEYSEEVDGGEREEEEEKAWGRLFPVGKGFTALGKFFTSRDISDARNPLTCVQATDNLV